LHLALFGCLHPGKEPTAESASCHTPATPLIKTCGVTPPAGATATAADADAAVNNATAVATSTMAAAAAAARGT